MAYISTINEHTYTIDKVARDQQNTVTLDGTEHSIDWQRIALLADSAPNVASTGGHYSLLIAGHSYDVFVRRITKANEKTGQTYEIQIAGQRFEVRVEDERTRKLAGLVRGGTPTGDAIIQAPMPGLVVGILAEAGAAVTESQPVVILEAMKMENDLLAPITGTIKEIYVNKGQAVEQGQALVVIAAET